MPACKLTLDLDLGDAVDSMNNEGVSFNWARPTVHCGGSMLTRLDGHAERICFKKLWQVDAANNVTNPFWCLSH